MDDVVLFSRTRWRLRKAVRELSQFFELCGFERHPDKTQTGRLAKGFDWLGIWFGDDGTTIAPRAQENHRVKRLRLYERARRRGLSRAEAYRRVQAYDTRWRRWADSVLRASQPDENT